jgi:hypothetical protein
MEIEKINKIIKLNEELKHLTKLRSILEDDSHTCIGIGNINNLPISYMKDLRYIHNSNNLEGEIAGVAKRAMLERITLMIDKREKELKDL